ncbi:MAG: hypothetical protein N2376_00995 [Clostridia bacterium]|nr:hypothetical protein [Clostridia bacterium]
MLEIIALLFLVKKNSFNAVQRGRKPLGFILLTPTLWILMELYGAFVGALLTANWLMSYVFAIVFAVMGGLASYYFAKTCKIKSAEPFEQGTQPSAQKKGFIRPLIVCAVVLVMAGSLVFLFQSRGENLESLATGRTIRYTPVTLEFQQASGDLISKEDFKIIKRVLTQRLEANRERNIRISLVDENTVKVRTESRYNNLETLKSMGREGIITFQEVDASKRDQANDYLPTGKVLLGTEDVKKAVVQKDKNTGQSNVLIYLTEEGTQKFADASERLAGQDIGVFLDDQLIFAPRVEQRIETSELVISACDEATAPVLANTINSEKLPFELIPIE